MNKIRLIVSAAALAVALPLMMPVQAQIPPPPPPPGYGHHPAYLHALTDLRDARWFLDHPRENALEDRERHAIAEVDRAIDLVQRAAYYDGKNIYEHPREDAYGEARGRLRRISELLRRARADIAQDEDNLQVRELQLHAVERVDEAIRLTESVMLDRERYYREHDEGRDRDRDRDRDRH